MSASIKRQQVCTFGVIAGAPQFSKVNDLLGHRASACMHNAHSPQAVASMLHQRRSFSSPLPSQSRVRSPSPKRQLSAWSAGGACSVSRHT